MKTNFISLTLIFVSILVAGMGFFGVACMNGMSNMCPSVTVVSFLAAVASFLVLFPLFLNRHSGGVFENFSIAWRGVFQEAIPAKDSKLLYWLSLHNKGQPNSFFGAYCMAN